jgi:hypothetical protein
MWKYCLFIVIGALLDLHIKDTQSAILAEEFLMLGRDESIAMEASHSRTRDLGGKTNKFLSYLDNSTTGEGGLQRVIDFTGFLQLYANRVGLNAKPRMAGKEFDLAVTVLNENIWTPNWHGAWIETSADTMQLVARSASGYFSENRDKPGRQPSSSKPAAAGAGVGSTTQKFSTDALASQWVELEDVVEVLLLSGINATDSVLAAAIKAMRVFLPGLAEKRFSFQEILMLVKYLHESHDLTLRGELDSRPRAAESATASIRNAFASAPEDDNTKFGKMMGTSTQKMEGKKSEQLQSTKHHQPTSKSKWRLPTHETAEALTRGEINNEFRKLDVMGEGRLTYLTLKTALEIRDIVIDDDALRRWIREYDIGNKGYVDFSDYEMIFRDAAASNKKLSSSSAAYMSAGMGTGPRRSESPALGASVTFAGGDRTGGRGLAGQSQAFEGTKTGGDFQAQMKR